MAINDLLGVQGQIGVSSQIGVPASVGGFSSAFPGLDDNEIQDIYKKTSNLSGTERNSQQNLIYQKKIKDKDFQKYVDDRNQTARQQTQQIVSKGDQKQADYTTMTNNFINWYREQAYQKGLNYKKPTDDDIMNNLSDNMKTRYLLYLNGDIDINGQPIGPRIAMPTPDELQTQIDEKYKQPEPTDLQRLGGQAKEVFGAAAAQVPETLGNIAGFGVKALGNISIDPGFTDFLGDKIQEIGTDTKKEFQTAFGIDENAIPTKISEIIIDSVPAFLMPEAKLGSLGKVGGALEGLAKTAPKTFNFIKKVTEGAINGGLITQVQNIAETGEPATAEETLVGAGLGGALPIVGAGLSKISKAIGGGNIKINEAKNILQPVLSKSEKEGLIKKGQISQSTMFKGAKVNIPDEVATEVANIPGIKSSNTTIDNVNLINQKIKDYANTLSKELEANNAIFDGKTINKYVDDLADKVRNSTILVGDSEQAFNKMIDRTKKIIKENGYTVSGLLNARKEFDSLIKNTIPSIFSSDASGKGKNMLAMGLRQGLNDFIAEKVPNIAVKDLLKSQANLYRAEEYLLPKAASELQLGTSNFAQQFKKLTKINLPTAGLAGLGLYISPQVTGTLLGTYYGGKLIGGAIKKLNPVVRQGLERGLKILGEQLQKSPTNKSIQVIYNQTKSLLEGDNQ